MRKTVIVPMLLFGLALVVSGCTSALPGFARRYASNGERIYYSGTSANDQISYSGGQVGGGMMGGGMMGSRLACADCHGQNAQGGVHFMHMTTMDAPDIRWSSLTGAHEEAPSDTAPEDHGSAMDHDPFTLETFALAVRTGVDPGGQPLDSAMPRWRMSDQDISDLIDFLQTVP